MCAVETEIYLLIKKKEKETEIYLELDFPNNFVRFGGR
jgi:hypothetical protein